VGGDGYGRLFLRARGQREDGYLFKNRTAFSLPREEIGELLEAAKADWRQVVPAIFGTLLEQALNPVERRKLGAHYTPRAYVERLVVATVIEPLREEWVSVRGAAEASASRATPRAPKRSSARFTTSCARRASSIPPAAPATFSTCRSN
jgi:hypothetical protein